MSGRTSVSEGANQSSFTLADRVRTANFDYAFPGHRTLAAPNAIENRKTLPEEGLSQPIKATQTVLVVWHHNFQGPPKAT